MNRPRRPGLRSVQLWWWGRPAATKAGFWPRLRLRLPPDPVGLAKQLAGALRPISKGEVAGSRAPGRWCVGGGLLSCRSLTSRWSACAGGVRGWREKGEGGSRQQMARTGLVLSDKRVGGGWPSAPGG